MSTTKKLLSYALFILCCGLGARSSSALDCTIRSIDISNYPEVRLFAAVLNDRGQPLPGLGTPDFSVQEAGETVPVARARPVRSEDALLRVVLAIDRSGSMKGTALASARIAAIDFITRLSPADEVGVVIFDDQVEVLTEPTLDHENVMRLVNGVVTRGDTSLRDAALAAAQMAAKGDAARRVVVVLTDGKDTTSKSDASSCLTQLQSLSVPLFTVALGEEIELDLLRGMSSLSGGRLLRAAQPQDLTSIYVAIAADIQAEYIICYRALPGPNPAVREVRLSTQAAGQLSQDTSHYENPMAAMRLPGHGDAQPEGQAVWCSNSAVWLPGAVRACLGAVLGLLVGLGSAWVVAPRRGVALAALSAASCTAVGLLLGWGWL